MGYYSFYKIFQDIIRKLFNIKIWKICLIIILFFLFCSGFCKCFGAFNDNGISNTFDVTYNNTTYSITVPESDLFDFEDVTNIYGVRNGDNLIFYVLVGYPDTTLRVRVDGTTNYIRNYVGNSTTELTGVNYVYHFWYYLPTGQYWNKSTELGRIVDNYSSSTYNFVYATKNVLDRYSNTVYFAKNSVSIKYPNIANSLTDLETLNFDVISVNAWDWSNKEFDILFYDRNVTNTSSTEGLYPKRVITLNKDTSYYQSDLTADPNKNAIYWIPISETGLNFYVGGNYEIRLAERVEIDPPIANTSYYYSYLGSPLDFTISSDISQDKIDAINKEIEDMTNEKYHNETMNSLNNINNNINNVNNNINNLNNALTNTTPDSSVSDDINNSLDFNNQNEGLNNLNGGFFSRLTTMLSNLLGYNLADDTSVSIPLPNSNKSIVLHSKIIYDNVTGALRLIINAFWVYIFSFYMWKFINKIYIAVSTGNILDTFSSSGEAITNDML